MLADLQAHVYANRVSCMTCSCVALQYRKIADVEQLPAEAVVDIVGAVKRITPGTCRHMCMQISELVE